MGINQMTTYALMRRSVILAVSTWLASACAPQQRVSAAAAVTVMSLATSDFYAELRELPAKGEDSLSSFYAGIGAMSVKQYYSYLLDSAVDSPVMIDGVSIPNPKQMLLHRRHVFAILAANFPTVAAWWRATGSTPSMTLGSYASYKANIAVWTQQLHAAQKPKSASLGLDPAKPVSALTCALTAGSVATGLARLNLRPIHVGQFLPGDLPPTTSPAATSAPVNIPNGQRRPWVTTQTWVRRNAWSQNQQAIGEARAGVTEAHHVQQVMQENGADMNQQFPFDEDVQDPGQYDYYSDSDSELDPCDQPSGSGSSSGNGGNGGSSTPGNPERDSGGL